jgi:4'-phosphopantetheinyl transferase
VPVLALHDVHVWLASLDEHASHRDELWQVLSPEERRRAARFVREVDRIRFGVGRGILRTMLGRYLDMQPEDIELRSTALGKPEVATDPGEGTIQFNLSHSGGEAAYAFTRGRRVGIDLEAMRPLSDLDGMVRQVLTAKEQHEYYQLASALRLRAFYNCWTQKEALTKATGEGLSRSLHSIRVAFLPGEEPQVKMVFGEPRAAARWRVHAIPTEPDYVATLVVEGEGCRPRCWRWHPMKT